MKDLMMLVRTLEATNEKLERIAQAIEYQIEEAEEEKRKRGPYKRIPLR